MATLKQTGIIYVSAHVGKVAQIGMSELDKQQGAAPLEKRYTTYITLAASLAPPILAYMGWLKGDIETAALVFGATVSTKLEDLALEAMPKAFHSPTFRPLSQRQPAAALPVGSTDSLVPSSPIAGF